MKPFTHDDACQYEPAMTFAEIAERIGSTEAAVFQVYSRAIIKLRRRPDLIRPLLDLVALRARIRRQHFGR